MNILRNLGRFASLTGIRPRSQTVSSPAGASSSIPTTIYPWVDDEEPLEEYKATGYHPASVGDILGSHYRILGKLGWGVYSTVWVVQNQRTDTYAALKLMTALATDAPELHELEYLEQMRDQDPHHPGHSHVLQLLDHFYCDGPNGRHLCLVTELLAESVAIFSTRWKNKRLPVPVVKNITRQVISGLDYLHNTCNIIHTDIKPSNILFGVNNMDHSALLSRPINVLPQTGPGGHTVLRTQSDSIKIPLPSEVNSDFVWNGVQVKLADVGVACWADQVQGHFTDLIQSPAVRAPEVCIGAGWGKPADIWSLGCMVYELVMGKSLIRPNIQEQSVPYMHILLFGEYPSHMVKMGKYSTIFFNPDGSLKYPMTERLSLEADIRKRGAPPDAEMFIDFLKLMLQLDPAERSSFEGLLAHKWLATD